MRAALRSVDALAVLQRIHRAIVFICVLFLTEKHKTIVIQKI